jgi:hypothetical protein
MGPHLARIVRTMAARFITRASGTRPEPDGDAAAQNLLGSMRPAILATLAAMTLIL